MLRFLIDLMVFLWMRNSTCGSDMTPSSTNLKKAGCFILRYSLFLLRKDQSSIRIVPLAITLTASPPKVQRGRCVPSNFFMTLIFRGCISISPCSVQYGGILPTSSSKAVGYSLTSFWMETILEDVYYLCIGH